MKRAEIREEVARTLAACGFRPSQYRWFGADLHVVVLGEFTTLHLPVKGMSKRKLQFELGRLTGWRDMLDRLGFGDRRGITGNFRNSPSNGASEALVA